MNSLRAGLALALLFLSTLALAQSDAQKSFDKLKTLAGTWEATYEGAPMQATLRITSMGHAIMHEMKGGGPEDPLTMIYMDGDRLLLTHYCDVGNRPRMTGKLSADGKTLDFDFLDVADYSSSQGGHMQHAVFTFIDADHHNEDWTFSLEGKPVMAAHLEMHRIK